MRFMLMVSFCFLVCPCFGASGIRLQDNLLHRISLRVEGPIQALHLDCGQGGATSWRGHVLAGETRHLTLPLPLPESRGGELVIEVEGEGRATVESWLDPGPPLPRFVQARALSGPAPPVRRMGWSAGLLLMAVGVTVLGLRARPPWALAVGLFGSLGLFFLPGPAEKLGGVLRVFEGQRDGEATRWLRTDAGLGSLALPAPGDLDRALLRVLAPGLDASLGRAPLTFAVDSSRGTGVHLAAPEGTRLALSQIAGPKLGDLRPELLAFGSLAQVWTREAGGGPVPPWDHRGSWGLGQAFPAPSVGPAPPGWLAAGLPQGRGILLAKVAGKGPGRGMIATESVWVRLVGFGE